MKKLWLFAIPLALAGCELAALPTDEGVAPLAVLDPGATPGVNTPDTPGPVVEPQNCNGAGCNAGRNAGINAGRNAGINAGQNAGQNSAGQNQGSTGGAGSGAPGAGAGAGAGG